MSTNPNAIDFSGVVVRLTHLDGPHAGRVDEFNKPHITVGRHPACDVVFPKDLRIVSRRHAEILFDGRKFFLRNLGINGCLVNGRPIDDALVRAGDVLTFAPHGPKLRFSCVVDGDAGTVAKGVNARIPRFAQMGTTFMIQAGIHIKSFSSNAVQIGSGPESDFVFRHPKVCSVHVSILLRDKQYVLRNISRDDAVLINGSAAMSDTVLRKSDVIELGVAGPKLRFIGAGCFVEQL